MKAYDIPQVRSFPLHIMQLINNAEIIGEGKFSYVYKHPKRKHEVIKVTKKRDCAYEAWLKIVLAHQNNPYFPRVYEVMQDEGGVIIVRMEKLTPLGDPHDSWPVQCSDKRAYRQYSQIECEALGMHMSTFVSRYQMQAVAAIRHITKTWRGDLHVGNVMLRGKQLVIIDPVWDSEGSREANDSNFCFLF